MNWQRWHWLPLAGLAVALVALSAPAQDAKNLKRPNATKLSNMGQYASGNKKVVEPNKEDTDRNKAEIEEVSQWYVYRLLDPKYHNETTKRADGVANTMNDLVTEANKVVPKPAPGATSIKESQADYAEAFGMAMNRHLASVLNASGGEAIVKVNAARMLANQALSGYEGLADTATTLLKDNTNVDGLKLSLKYYAAQALERLFAQTQPGEPTKSVFRKQDREVNAALALLGFLKEQSFLPPTAADDEVDALRVVRRQVIAALGACRYGVLPDPKTNKPIEYPAFALLRVMANDGLNPPVSLAERVEAAIGLAQLRPDDKLNVDVAAVWIGTVASDMALAKARQTSDMSIPWRLQGARLREALEKWKDAATRAKQGKFASDLWNTNISQLLDSFKDPAPDSTSSQALKAWLQRQNVANKPLIDGVPATMLKPPMAEPAAGN
jgi:hypothetical protein